uniref:Connector enhancer of kinase suppressor of Ras 1 n=1 Tax=Phasianus colchicus TaxID=9054 RepID=A0A669PLI6_PHACC
MEPVGAWGPAQTAAWLRGLDAAVQGYPFEEWGLAGSELLRLSEGALEALGVWRVGHQELLLEAVEQLRALVSNELASTSLRTLTERLRELAQCTETVVLEGSPGGATPQPPPIALLACVVDLIGAAKKLFSWLNRYLFSTLNDFSSTRDIVLLCARLVEVLQTHWGPSSAGHTPSPCFYLQCQHIIGICKSIVDCSPPALLDRRAMLQHMELPPRPQVLQPGKLHKAPCCLYLLQALAVHGGRILPGDEIVQVNEQVVVSWGRGHAGILVWLGGTPVQVELRGACVWLGRIWGMQELRPGGTQSRYGGSRGEGFIPPLGTEVQPRSLFTGAGKDVVWEAGTPPGTPSSPCALQACTAEWAGGSSCRPKPEAPQNAAGVATRLSRRRVSCRDLGRVDCDGWLLKKKDHVGFMAQKWKRCWFVLKGHTLYWYNHPNDDKAAGLINVATYNLESTREQKKKYVFQLSHEKYKPFVFAAETLADLSMWVSHLITAKTKHALAHQPIPHREEGNMKERDGERNVGGPVGFWGCPMSWRPSPCSEPCEEDLESLMWCLRQGGVSLIGRQRFLTQEQCRKSFIRRNKNPRINEKVHAVRALQSTLKAKLAELQALEQLLDDAALTSEKFQRWKEEHQDLYQELQEWWARQTGIFSWRNASPMHCLQPGSLLPLINR